MITYKLKISTDGTNWSDVEGGREFPANFDDNTVVINVLNEPVKCLAIRIYPWTWKDNIRMRSKNSDKIKIVKTS